MESVKSLMRLSIAALGVASGLFASGCTPEPQPRSFADYLEDRMLMDGTLARCNADRIGTHNDLDCANARRAAVTIALRVEEAKREELERESERKLSELRDELARREAREREALAAAEAAKQEAYEAIWKGDAVPADAAGLLDGANRAAGNTAPAEPVPNAPRRE